MFRLVVMSLLIGVARSEGNDTCVFPPFAVGRWITVSKITGTGTATIYENSYPQRGTCIEWHLEEGDDYVDQNGNNATDRLYNYIFQDPNDPSCYMCITFNEKLLRQTDLYEYRRCNVCERKRDTLMELCDLAGFFNIREQLIKVREKNCSVASPLRDLVFNQGANACDVKSSVVPSEDGKHLDVHLKDCQLKMPDQDLRVECLVSWREGVDKPFKLVTKVADGPDRGKHRCFSLTNWNIGYRDNECDQDVRRFVSSN